MIVMAALQKGIVRWGIAGAGAVEFDDKCDGCGLTGGNRWPVTITDRQVPSLGRRVCAGVRRVLVPASGQCFRSASRILLRSRCRSAALRGTWRRPAVV